MNEAKAQELEAKLRGAQVSDWTIEGLTDHGKSAAVFRAMGPSGQAAVKIFDDELIAKYGDDTQFGRIERELELVGKRHPNLVPILGGGIDPITNNHFIVMEYLDGPNVKKCLDDIPAETISSLINQLASAARFLEQLGFVHRDIKPENIILLDGFSRLVLLDLGVLRPLAGSDITDADGIHAFVGTLQYSSPEFLLREEEDSPDGWRALTFYQIGGVLHDLIMRRALFAEFANPYARLVNAVQRVTPEIQNSAVPYYLVELARCCLLKNWRTRLKLVGWASFEVREPTDGDSGDSIKQRVTNRAVLAQARLGEEEATSLARTHAACKKLRHEAIGYLRISARSIRAQNAKLPPLKLLPNTPDEAGFGIQFRQFAAFGLGRDLTILVRIDVLDAAARVIGILACGCLGQFAREDALGTSYRSVFQGTYDGAAVYAALEACIYDLIDQAQQLDDFAEDAPAVWLYVREDS